MRVAIPLKNENEIFANAGHAPFFGIFELKGAGAFKSFSLVDMRANPRANLEAEHGCMHSHAGMSEEELEAHKREHDVLADLAQDCSMLLVKRACKNTTSVMQKRGIAIKKLPQEVNSAMEALRFALS